MGDTGETDTNVAVESRSFPCSITNGAADVDTISQVDWPIFDIKRLPFYESVETLVKGTRGEADRKGCGEGWLERSRLATL